MNRNLPRKVKATFFRWRLHRVFRPLAYAFEWLARMTALSAWIENNRSFLFNDYPSGFDYQKRYQLYEQVRAAEELDDVPVTYLEFGVAAGHSFRWWVSNLQHPEARFYGFDTFTGLPEDWGPFKAGDMSNGNKPPEIADDRVRFFQGLFQKTLPAFLDGQPLRGRKVIHLDADLYSATLYVLAVLDPYLHTGDLILFDEFNVPTHEFAAFRDYTRSFYREMTPIAAVNNYYQTAFRVV